MLLDDGHKDLKLDLFPTVRLMDTEPEHCRWPYDDFLCCGRAKQKHSSYCSDHHARAHQKTHGLTPRAEPVIEATAETIAKILSAIG